MRRSPPSGRSRLSEGAPSGRPGPGAGGGPQRSDAERALEVAYRYINRRERTTAEVRSRLERDGLEPAAVAAALAELAGFGYIDDARYARLFVEDRRTLDGWGRGRIERALAERGIQRDLIAAVLDGREDLPSEAARALELLRRRIPHPSRDLRERRRALGMLVRKGYDSEVAYDAVRAWSGGAHEDVPPPHD